MKMKSFLIIILMKLILLIIWKEYQMDSLVSVIMSAYNAEESLGSSIESILNKTYENLELLIMDDGSSD